MASGPKPGGVLEIFGPEGHTVIETFTCGHCQKITPVENRRKLQEVSDICRSCMKLVCTDCAGKACRPWEQEMERQESRGRFLRDIARCSR